MKKGQCAHFRSPAHYETCAVHISYLHASGLDNTIDPHRDAYNPLDLIAASQVFTADRLPCFSQMGRSQQPVKPCPKYREPTEEEIALHNDIEHARQAVHAAKLEKMQEAVKGWTGDVGEFDCPCCLTGTVTVIRGAHNGGKMLFRCSTDGCFSHMEQ